MTDRLVHICARADWERAQHSGALTPESLAAQGFVHLSAPEHVHLPANRLFAGRTDLVLLHIDPARLADEVRFEPGVPGDPAGMAFPHLYGPLPVAAVTAVVDYLPDENGRFGHL